MFFLIEKVNTPRSASKAVVEKMFRFEFKRSYLETMRKKFGLMTQQDEDE